LLLILFLPSIPLIALLVFLMDGRPVLFAQERVGKDENLFTLYKFRTMRDPEDGDDEGSIGNSWKKRITRTGKFLRATRLDEIPQLFNVIRGDIHLVGPRPFISHEVDMLSSKVPYYKLRFLVKPGITGHAQLSAGYENDPETAVQKLEYDLFYIKYRSIWLDLAIIIRTVSAMVLRRGE
ncbi:sugar transferase, partial [bacterium]|nr:sugar transferase [bacterium]